MNEFLAQFAATRAEDEHAIMVLDRAGWHKAKRLVIPSNVTRVWLPPYSPQLNPVERVWLFLRERHLSHRLLDTYDPSSTRCAAHGMRSTRSASTLSPVAPTWIRSRFERAGMRWRSRRTNQIRSTGLSGAE